MCAVFIYCVGTAGSGKSTLVGAFSQWITEHRYSSYIINLDPGVDSLPYEADMDIREQISLQDIMTEMCLGPNGAQIAAADILAMQAGTIGQEVDGVDADVVLIDTPGQIELFAFRHSSRKIVDALGSDQSMLLFLFDPFLSQTPNGFISQLMLSATVEFRFGLPFLPVLSKSDMLEDEVKEKILKWSDDIDALYDAATSETATMDKQLGVGLFRTLEDLGAYKTLIPTSAETGEGLEDIYAQVLNIFHGGDDLEPR